MFNEWIYHICIHFALSYIVELQKRLHPLFENLIKKIIKNKSVTDFSELGVFDGHAIPLHLDAKLNQIYRDYGS